MADARPMGPPPITIALSRCSVLYSWLKLNCSVYSDAGEYAWLKLKLLLSDLCWPAVVLVGANAIVVGN